MSLLLERYAEILERLRAELESCTTGLAWSLSRYSAPVGRGTPRQDSDMKQHDHRPR